MSQATSPQATVDKLVDLLSDDEAVVSPSLAHLPSLSPSLRPPQPIQKADFTSSSPSSQPQPFANFPSPSLQHASRLPPSSARPLPTHQHHTHSSTSHQQPCAPQPWNHQENSSHSGPYPAQVSPEKTSNPRKSLKDQAPFFRNSTSGLVPLCSTPLFLARLSAWAAIVSKLLRYFELIFEREQKAAEWTERANKEMTSILVTATAPPANSRLETSAPLFSENETLMAMFQSVSESHDKHHLKALSAHCELIQVQIFPTLRTLAAEIRKRLSDAEVEWAAFDKELEKDREFFLRLTLHLRVSLDRTYEPDATFHLSSSEAAAIPKDPWLAASLVKKHIAYCLSKQDYVRKVLYAQQDSFCALESLIITHIKAAMTTYYERRFPSVTQECEVLKSLKQQVTNTISSAVDWERFTESHCQFILSKALPSISADQITYEGVIDPMANLIKEGILLKKESTLFKNIWKPHRVVMTAAGFFHGFSVTASSGSRAQLSPGSTGSLAELDAPVEDKPAFGFHITDCSLGPMMLNEKEPEEFVLTEKVAGLWGGEVKHKLKGENMDVSAEWWSLLSEKIRTTAKRFAATDNGKPVDISETPISSRNGSSSNLPADVKASGFTPKLSTVQVQEESGDLTSPGIIPVPVVRKIGPRLSSSNGPRGSRDFGSSGALSSSAAPTNSPPRRSISSRKSRLSPPSVADARQNEFYSMEEQDMTDLSSIPPYEVEAGFGSSSSSPPPSKKDPLEMMNQHYSTLYRPGELQPDSAFSDHVYDQPSLDPESETPAPAHNPWAE